LSGNVIIKVFWQYIFDGVNELKSEVPIILYPNPVKDYLQIQLQPKQAGSEYYIADQTGRRVMNGNLMNEFNTLNLTSLCQGCYFLTVGSEKRNNYKLIKQ